MPPRSTYLGVRWRGAGSILLRKRLQPARGSVGRWQGHQHVGAPPPARRELEGFTGALTQRARAVCAAQNMFYSASAFNQPVAAWDVGQVTSMLVRRRPPRERGRGWGGRPRAVLFHTVEDPQGALPFATGARTQRARAVCAAQNLFFVASAFNQPVEAWDVGQVNSMRVRRHPHVGSWRGWGGWPGGGGPLSPEHSLGVHVLCARRRPCSLSRLSTSPWMHGTLARSPT